MRRRRYLSTLAAGAALLAGCTGGSDTPTPTDGAGNGSGASAKMQRFERNLDGIPDPQLSRKNDTVRLRYAVEEVDRDAIEQQTRTVAIAWSQVIGAGWDAKRLEVEVLAGDTVILSYHVRAEWASKWNQREISPAKYEAYINGTVETATPTSAG